LQELPELVHLDGSIHVVKPLIGLFDGLFAGHFHAGFQFGARFHIDGEFPRQFEVNGIELAREIPLGGEILHGRGWSHGFTIQLGTSRLNRAATSVFPG